MDNCSSVLTRICFISEVSIFRLRSHPQTRENRAHCHPILPKPGKLGALALGARVARLQGGLTWRRASGAGYLSLTISCHFPLTFFERARRHGEKAKDS